MNSRQSTSVARRVPFNDLSVQWRQIAPAVREDMERIFEKSSFCLGPYADAFEQEVAKFLGVKYAIGVNSGTSALHLAALAAGVGPGDEVIVPAHTFIATLWGVIYAGASPVLCDVERDTGNIDMTAAERCLSPRVKAIIPVHLYGQPSDMTAVTAFAERHGIQVIEDAAQSIGALWQGRAVGSIGRLGCYSFYPGKNLGAAGEAGLVVTNDDRLASNLRELRNHGQSERYVHNMIGYNYRLDGLQAAVLSRKLPLLSDWTNARRELAAHYTANLKGLPLEIPPIRHGDHVWHLYVVRTPERDKLKAHLGEHGIETGLHYPVPLNKQPCLANMNGAKGSFPVAEHWAANCLSLPLYSGMTVEDADSVISAIRSFYDPSQGTG